jgi:hypothetical protein
LACIPVSAEPIDHQRFAIEAPNFSNAESCVNLSPTDCAAAHVDFDCEIDRRIVRGVVRGILDGGDLLRAEEITLIGLDAALRVVMVPSS